MARACSEPRKEILVRALVAAHAAVESSCSRDRLDSDEALEDALRRELIDIAFTAGISDVETLCDRALRHLNKVSLP